MLGRRAAQPINACRAYHPQTVITGDLIDGDESIAPSSISAHPTTQSTGGGKALLGRSWGGSTNSQWQQWNA